MAIESIPTILRTYTGGEKAVEAEGATLAEVIDDLESQHTGLRDRLVDNGDLRRFVNVYVNDEDVRFIGGLETAVTTATVTSCRPSPAAVTQAEAGPGVMTRYDSLLASVGRHPAGRAAAARRPPPTYGSGPSSRTATRPARSRTARRWR